MRRELVSEILFETAYLGFAFVLQSSLVSYMAIGPARPDLILGCTVYIALWRGPVHSTVAGFVAGLLQDLSFGGGLGLNSLCKSVTAFLVSHVSSRIFKERYWTQLVVLGCSVLVHDLLYFVFLHPGSVTAVGLSLVTISLGSALYTVLVFPAYDFVMRKLFFRREGVERETTVVPPQQ
ncbi:MAG: rod shape-determining protein MreD [Candidatus Eiseniibacteriota bacterium]|nr:MAG: rod shape-determining protein MreD [Candidatus Eisenbacteria bacterium]